MEGTHNIELCEKNIYISLILADIQWVNENRRKMQQEKCKKATRNKPI